MDIDATVRDYLEDVDVSVEVRVATEEEDDSPYELILSCGEWLSEKEINQIIAVLQKAKKVRKTKQLN